MNEGGDADRHEREREPDVNRAPPAVGAGRGHPLEQSGGQADRSQQDGQRGHSRVVELEDDEGEDHPHRPGHERNPPQRIAALGTLVHGGTD